MQASNRAKMPKIGTSLSYDDAFNAEDVGNLFDLVGVMPDTQRVVVGRCFHDPALDKVLGVVQNQSDVNDCVAVPRGIFKAYLWIMGGFGLIGIANALPAKFAKTKTAFREQFRPPTILTAYQKSALQDNTME